MLISSSNISGDMNCVCRVICQSVQNASLHEESNSKLCENRLFSVVVKMAMDVVPVSLCYLTYVALLCMYVCKKLTLCFVHCILDSATA